jgi:hypothetical protein
MGFVNVKELFVESDHRIIKSHCFICHNKINTINKEHRGNACVECNARANKVARGIFSESDSDLLLSYRLVKPQEEVWQIDGVYYKKFPDGTLEEMKDHE